MIPAATRKLITSHYIFSFILIFPDEPDIPDKRSRPTAARAHFTLTRARCPTHTHTSASLLASQHRHLSAAVAAFVRRPKTTNCLLTNDSNHNHPHHHYMQFYRDSHDFPESFHQKHDLITTCAVWIVLSEEASLCSAPLSLLSLSLFLRCVLVIISLPLASSDGACSRAGSLPPSGLRGLSAQTTLRTLSL